MHKYFILVLGLTMKMAFAQAPLGFIHLNKICPTLIFEMSYDSIENFTGEVVRGYKAKSAFLAEVPAKALCRVQEKALKLGYTLKIYDSYRPVKAVSFFQEWAQRPETNFKVKELYYPNFSRLELFEQGYIAKQSSHSRGSAVDLSLSSIDGMELDMGSRFDYFDDISHTYSPKISQQQRQNRQLLKELMESEGFKNFSQEWWHYSYRPEPFPNDYFDFDVE